MKDPVKVAAGRKGGKAKHKGNKGFAANPELAKTAGREGAIKRWNRQRREGKQPISDKPSALSKYPLFFEVSPNEPKPSRKTKRTRKTKK